jgi:hypothetical protein
MRLKGSQANAGISGAAIMMLVDHGKLSLTDDITRFIPDDPAPGTHLSIWSLGMPPQAPRLERQLRLALRGGPPEEVGTHVLDRRTLSIP